MRDVHVLIPSSLTLCSCQVAGKPVGVTSSRARPGDVKLSPALGDDNDPDSNLSKLFELIRSYPDTKMAVNAALKAVMKLPQRAKTESLDHRGDDPSSQAGDRPGSRGESSLEPFRRRAEDDAPLPDPNKFLEQYPKTRQLVETFRANPNTHNKTPLAILHEYATRLNLEVLPLLCQCWASEGALWDPGKWLSCQKRVPQLCLACN